MLFINDSYNFQELKQYYNFIFSNKYWEMIETNPDKPWNWYGLSRNKNITM